MKTILYKYICYTTKDFLQLIATFCRILSFFLAITDLMLGKYFIGCIILICSICSFLLSFSEFYLLDYKNIIRKNMANKSFEDLTIEEQIEILENVKETTLEILEDIDKRLSDLYLKKK